MRWAFWRKEPDPPPRPLTRRFPKKETGQTSQPPAPSPGAEGPAESLDELAPMPEAAAKAAPPRAEPGAAPAADPTPSGGVPAIGRSGERLGDLLVKSGALSQEDLERALDTQRELRADTYLGEILVRENLVDEEKLADMISQQYRIPRLRMEGHEYKKDLLALLTPDDAWRLRAIPTDKLGRILSVAMTNPLDERAVAELGRITGLKIKPLIVVGSEMRRALEYVYPGRGPSTVPRTRTAPPATLRQETAPVTGRFVAPAPDSGTKPAALAPGANTILRRATAPASRPVAPAPATEPAAAAEQLVAEQVSEEMFEAATSSNPEYLLKRVPEPGQRRRALPATSISDAEFLLYVGSLPRPKA